MFIKNLIQQNIELVEKVGEMRNNILMVESKYDISCCVLGQNGEVSEGYLINLKEFSTINEAVDNIDSLQKGLYYTGEKYIIGDITENFNSIKGKYLNIYEMKLEEI